MSLLDKASLIQIPSGYKNGKLYSVKPNPTYGSEQISNGDFSDGSTGWTIINGTVTDKYNANMTAYQSGIRIIPFLKNGTFKVVFDLVITSGNCKFDAGGGNDEIYTTSGRKELTITNPTKFEFNAFNLGWVGTVDNVSVKEVLVADGDFDFSRSSSGTRVNSEGLIEVAKVIGTTEEVTNGDFTSGGSWSGSASISSGQLTKTSGGLAYQSGVVTANKYYKVVVDVESLDGATQLYFGGNQYTLSVGVQTIEAVGGTSNTFVGFNNGYSSGSGSVFNSISVIEYIENDVPRLDYSDGSCASLLLEPQRTNAINHSNDYTQWSNTQFTINGNSVTSPEGITNGTKIIPSTSNTEKFLDKGGFSRTSGQYITHTVYAKASGYNFLYLSNSASRLYAVYDLQQGLVIYNNSNGTDFNNHSASIELFGNGWYRCELIGQAQNTVASYFRISCGTTAINSSTQGLFQGDGTSGIEVYGSQVELNASYSTSYIPTTSATATRTADSGILTSASALIGQTEGTLYSEFNLTEDSAFTILEINLGNSTNNRILAYRNASYIAFIVQVGGVIEINNSTLVTFLDTNKIAITYQANNFKIYLNGSLVKAYTSGSIPSGFDTIDFQDNNLAGKKQSIKSLILFKEILSDTELATLTTL